MMNQHDTRVSGSTCTVKRRLRGKAVELYAVDAYHQAERRVVSFRDGQIVQVVWNPNPEDRDVANLMSTIGYVYDDAGKQQLRLTPTARWLDPKAEDLSMVTGDLAALSYGEIHSIVALEPKARKRSPSKARA